MRRASKAAPFNWQPPTHPDSPATGSDEFLWSFVIRDRVSVDSEELITRRCFIWVFAAGNWARPGSWDCPGSFDLTPGSWAPTRELVSLPHELVSDPRDRKNGYVWPSDNFIWPEFKYFDTIKITDSITRVRYDMMFFLLWSGPYPGLAFLGWRFTLALRVLNISFHLAFYDNNQLSIYKQRQYTPMQYQNKSNVKNRNFIFTVIR